MRWVLFSFLLCASVECQHLEDARCGPGGIVIQPPDTVLRLERTDVKLSGGWSRLASRILGFSAAHARSPKELRESKAGDQGAATNAGCKEDQFSGNDLHSNSCRVSETRTGDLFSR